MLLDHGRLVFSGTAVEAVAQMLREQAPLVSSRPELESAQTGPIRIVKLDVAGETGDEIHTGTGLLITLRYTAYEPVEALFAYSVWTHDQLVCVTGDRNPEPILLPQGDGELTCLIPELPLLPARYLVRASLADPRTHLPMATYGWPGGGLAIDVSASAHALTNAQTQLGQLVRVQTRWGGCESAGSRDTSRDSA
jgi:hypothetical protein